MDILIELPLFGRLVRWKEDISPKLRAKRTNVYFKKLNKSTRMQIVLAAKPTELIEES